jgi:hypothetical protein
MKKPMSKPAAPHIRRALTSAGDTAIEAAAECG